jgi:ABC-type branched-subunit amino acid transport system ATPase component
VTTLALDAKDLTVGYNQVAVISDMNIQVAPGEIVALLGRNGAGKTTTVHTIAGLLSPIRGTVTLGETAVTCSLNRRVKKHGLALITEERAIIRGLTLLENLKVAKASAERVFEVFPELHKCRNRKAGLLSGGEQQMLAMGRCLATGPKLLLVDELSFGLSPRSIERLGIALVSAAQGGLAVLMVEQQLPFAISIASRGYIASAGGLQAASSSDDLGRMMRGSDLTYMGEA